MFELKNANRELIDGLISGKKTKEFVKWTRIYKVLKFFGIVGSGVALICLGITPQFGVIAGSIFVLLCGVREIKLNPARKDKTNEDIAKQNLMLEIQSKIPNGVIDGRTFKLERTARVDCRQQVYFNETKVSAEGIVTEESKAYSKVGVIEKYVRGTDDRNGFVCWLKLVKDFVVEQTMLSEGNGYVNRVVPRYSMGMLESHEVDNIPEEVVIQTVEYDSKKKNAMVKSRRK